MTPRGADAEQDLARLRHRVRPLLEPEGAFVDDRRAHSGMLRAMKLEGVHHVTCITGDAPGNVRFYAGELGLRMVKKTVNQDDPTVYHLFYADERGSSGADITFFEYPGVAARPRRRRDGAPRLVPGRLRGVARVLADARRRRDRTTGRSSSTIPKG